MDAVSEIKSRISIEELVAGYVQLKKAGRHFKALCPFHQERTPSFFVSTERQLAYCFGCHKGGDIFKFIQEIEGLDFRGALEFLAEKAGVTLPKASPQDKNKKSEREKLIDMHEKAADFFVEQLWNTADGKKILGYLKERGLKEKTVRDAKLGFAPDKGNLLFIFLLEKGFSRNEILTAGLAVSRTTEQGECIDRFRMRLIFPIKNLNGDICAFGGRAIRKGDEPKYLNSPETPVYFKNSILFCMHDARQEIRAKKYAVVVEGYMDALACHQAGYKNAVAVSGTALTNQQLAILKRFTSDLIFAFDRDEAGKLATQRAIELALSEDFNLRVAVWEGSAKDPDECIRKNPKLFEKALDSAVSAMPYLFESFEHEVDKKSVEGKKKFIELALPFLSRIKSPVELDGRLKELSLKIDVSLSSIYDEVKRFQGKQGVLNSPNRANQDEKSFLTKNFQIEEYFIGMLLTYPEIFSVVNQLIKPEDINDIGLQNIYRILSTQYNQTLDDEPSEKSKVRDWQFSKIDPEIQERVNILSMFAESKMGSASWDVLEREVKDTARAILKRKFDREKRLWIERFRGAQAKGKAKTELLESYQKLLAEEEIFLKKTI